MTLEEQTRSPTRQSPDRRLVLAIAWPIILSNISTPLLGLVDTAVIGNLGDPALIGAIAVGSMIFSFLYWGFGFLRMGTTGLVAQARGAGDATEILYVFCRALILGAVIGIALLLLQSPLNQLAFLIIDGSAAVESAAAVYFQIRIWSAPFNLIQLAVLGYLLGQQKTGLMLILQLLLNGTNILLDIVFVVGFGWGVAGVAAATVIAEVLAAAVGLILVYHHTRSTGGRETINLSRLFRMEQLSKMLVVNRDIMIRTLCLIFAFAWFTNEGAKAGDVLLATNAILMQFVTFSAFFLDGFALAGETLVGDAVGARNSSRLNRTIRYISELGLITAASVSLVYLVAGPAVIDLLTNAPEVRASSREYLAWAVAAPVISLWCYLLDGIFIGATRTHEMRNAMVISLIAYLAAWYLLTPLSNHGLWLSLMVYFVARALSLYWYMPRVRNLQPATAD